MSPHPSTHAPGDASTDPRAALAPQPLRGNFVLLRADALRLLLPREDVGAASHLGSAPKPTDLPGLFEHAGSADASDNQALMALSNDLLPMTTFPADRFLVTPIDTPMGPIGFGWSEVSVLIDARLQARPIPPLLVADGSPLRRFVEIDGNVVFCCDAHGLGRHLFPNPA